MKPIILYYSRTGNTKKFAEELEKDFDCSSIEIVPSDEYLDYAILHFRGMLEGKGEVEPSFKTDVPDLSEYDTVFVGYPVWAQDLPMFVLEFLKKCDLKGKTIIPFATYALTETNFAKKTLDEACPESEIKLPFQFGMFNKPDYEEWVAKIKEAL